VPNETAPEAPVDQAVEAGRACAENLDQLLDLVVEALGEVKQSPSLLSAGLAQVVKRGLVWDG
jgi:hypothetical protein